MIVRRAAESAQADRIISRVSLQELRRQSVRAGEIHAGGLVDRVQTGFLSRHRAIRVFRRVLRGSGEEFAVRTVVEVEQLLLVARERAHITHANHGVPADVVLNLETETLNAGDLSFLISGDHIADAESDLPGALANRGEGTEVELWVEEQRRLAGSGEGQFIALHPGLDLPIAVSY